MELKIEYLPIKALKPYEKNTRKHTDYDVGEIAKSITECGFNDPRLWKTKHPKLTRMQSRL